MTEIEKKALALAIETREEGRYRLCPDPTLMFGLWEALCRAIEQHEAFRQEVSDAIERNWSNTLGPPPALARFIIAKPDPLAKLLESIAITLDADDLRAALDEAGLEIREKGK